MKSGVYFCRNHWENHEEYCLLATKRFISHLRRAGVILLGLGVVWALIYITK